MLKIIVKMMDVVLTSNELSGEEAGILEDAINDLLDQFASAINCPSNWRGINEEIISYQEDKDNMDGYELPKLSEDELDTIQMWNVRY